MNAWGYTDDEAFVVNHGIDTDFWKPDNSIKRDNVLLSVVNDWPNRDWCCGFNLWRRTVKLGTENQLPVSVFGDSPGLSIAAKDKQHLRQIYQNSSIFYNTSLFSPIPTVLMEAMACGCAIISTNNCMIPEVIEHGYNGLLSNDPDELTSYCELLLNKPEFARRLGNNAMLTILEKYNMQNFIDNWNTLLYNTVGDFRC
jgi:glycosyltransferase involved in cell wall biosynthesis